MPVSIWWTRRDLRLSDNPALTAAVKATKQVIPVYILDPKLIDSKSCGTKRLAFLYNNLYRLDASLREYGSRLTIRIGAPADELSKLSTETGASTIFAEPDFTPYALKRDRLVESLLPIQWIGSPVVHSPGTVMRSQGGPYAVFTPFRRAWKILPIPSRQSILPIPEIQPGLPEIDSLPAPQLSRSTIEELFPSGEENAGNRLLAFTHGKHAPIYQYNELRNRPDLEGTSQISPYLRFGIISARQAVLAALDAIQAARDLRERQNAETWLDELIWREFYVHILFHFPKSAKQSLRYRDLAWQNEPELYLAWCEGHTGYPIVDAAQRQLAATGWMHNRLRMIVASFLTKDLLIDWRWGARFFMQHLVDGDLASNTGGWQWTAGTGTDAAPYFRFFNPIKQSIKYDPDGVYIRRWLPELAKVPNEYIHDPWKMPEDAQNKARCRVGFHYPYPIIDHGFARLRTLQAFRNVQ